MAQKRLRGPGSERTAKVVVLGPQAQAMAEQRLRPEHTAQVLVLGPQGELLALRLSLGEMLGSLQAPRKALARTSVTSSNRTAKFRALWKAPGEWAAPTGLIV